MIKEWVDTWWPRDERGKKRSSWYFLRPKNLLVATLLAAQMFAGIGYNALPTGKRVYASSYTEEPTLPGKIWNIFTDHSFVDNLKAYAALADPQVTPLLPGKARWELDNWSSNEKDLSWTVLDNKTWPEDIDARRDPLLRQMGLHSETLFRRSGYGDADTYILKPSFSSNLIGGVRVMTPVGKKDEIVRVIIDCSPDEFTQEHPEWDIRPGVFDIDQKGKYAITPELMTKAHTLVDQIYNTLNIEEIAAALPHYEPPPPPEYPDIPFRAVVFNLPLLVEKREEDTAEITLEHLAGELSKGEQERAKGDIYQQYIAGNDTFQVPASSLFATPALVKRYKQHIETANYKKGFEEPLKQAFKQMYRNWNTKDLAPKRYTFVGLGSGDGTWDAEILRTLYGWTHLEEYFCIDDQVSIANAGGTIADTFQVPVDGASVDLEHDPVGLAKTIADLQASTEGPIVYFVKDVDINQINYLNMYEVLARNMRPGDVLIRGGPLEHEHMANTYDGIEQAATEYLRHLGLSPTKWAFQGTQYDPELQEFQTSFVCERSDLLPHNGFQMVFEPGVRLNHLTSRRKDLRKDLEHLGLKLNARFDGGGYAFDFYQPAGTMPYGQLLEDGSYA